MIVRRIDRAHHIPLDQVRLANGSKHPKFISVFGSSKSSTTNPSDADSDGHLRLLAYRWVMQDLRSNTYEHGSRL